MSHNLYSRLSLRKLVFPLALLGTILLVDTWTGFPSALGRDSRWYPEVKVHARDVIRSHTDPESLSDHEFTSPKREPPDTRNVSFWTIGEPFQTLPPEELEIPTVDGATDTPFNPALLRLPPGSDWTVAVVARGPHRVLKDVWVEQSHRHARVETLLA
jgi:hypothetical protein